MWQLQSNISQLWSGLSIKDALPYLSAIIASALTWFAARSSALVQLQTTLLDASRKMVADLQKIHAADGARTTQLESEIIRLRGEHNGDLARIDALIRQNERKQRFIDDLLDLCKDNHLVIPEDWRQ